MGFLCQIGAHACKIHRNSSGIVGGKLLKARWCGIHRHPNFYFVTRHNVEADIINFGRINRTNRPQQNNNQTLF